MPTFRAEDAVPSADGVFLFPFPNAGWLARAILGALTELAYEQNWFGADSEEIQYALREMRKSLGEYQILPFNPFPIGLILPFGGTTTPAGYLACDGGSYLADDYPELFTAIGTTYGGSGGSFNVPNLLDRVPVGSGSSFSPAAFGGEQTVTLDTSTMPSHSHGSDNPTVIDPSHSHVEGTALPTAITIGAGVPAPAAIPSVGSTAPAFTGISVLAGAIHSTGGDGAHNNMQPYLAVPFVIYAGR